MRHYNFDGSFGQLGQFGIDCLTGEACNISLRILCDLTLTGVRVIRECFGMPQIKDVHLQFAENWNRGSKADPHVASIMLTRDMIRDIAIFGMFTAHECNSVLVFDGGRICGLKLNEGESFDEIQKFTARYAGQYDWDDATGSPIVKKEPVDGFQRSITLSKHPRRGLANVHQMTGRAMSNEPMAEEDGDS